MGGRHDAGKALMYVSYRVRVLLCRENIDAIARERLGACLVASGSVEAFGADSVVVFTQIVRSSDRVHVWARLDTVAVIDVIERVVPAVTDGMSESVEAC